MILSFSFFQWNYLPLNINITHSFTCIQARILKWNFHCKSHEKKIKDFFSQKQKLNEKVIHLHEVDEFLLSFVYVQYVHQLCKHQQQQQQQTQQQKKFVCFIYKFLTFWSNVSLFHFIPKNSYSFRLQWFWPFCCFCHVKFVISYIYVCSLFNHFTVNLTIHSFIQFLFSGLFSNFISFMVEEFQTCICSNIIFYLKWQVDINSI